jgi:hypothetical protein
MLRFYNPDAYAHSWNQCLRQCRTKSFLENSRIPALGFFHIFALEDDVETGGLVASFGGNQLRTGDENRVISPSVVPKGIEPLLARHFFNGCERGRTRTCDPCLRRAAGARAAAHLQ